MQRLPSIRRSIGITGSPGTGKKSVAKQLSEITGMDLLLINDFAIDNHLGTWKLGEFLVDLPRLKQKLNTKGKIVCGHLLPYLVPDSKLDYVVVLRCSPDILKRRYAERKYSKEKIAENVVGEMIGVIAAKAIAVYRPSKLMEFDTSRFRNPGNVARMIIQTIRGQRKSSFGRIDWLASQRSGATLAKLGLQDSF